MPRGSVAFNNRASVIDNLCQAPAVLEESDEDDFDEALDHMAFAMSGVVNT